MGNSQSKPAAASPAKPLDGTTVVVGAAEPIQDAEIGEDAHSVP